MIVDKNGKPIKSLRPVDNTKIKCCICGKTIPLWKGNNPYPIREYSVIGSSENRCCPECNEQFVFPARMFIHNFCSTEEEEEKFHERMKKLSYKELCSPTKK